MTIDFGLHPLGLKAMLLHWWQYMILGVLGISGLVAVLFLMYLISTLLRRLANHKGGKGVTVDLTARRLLKDLGAKMGKFRQGVAGRPKSFGLYLGCVSSPMTEDEKRVLEQWDMLVVDPFQSGVTEGLNSLASPPRYILARFDIGKILEGVVAEKSAKTKAILKELQRLHPSEGSTPYNGILLANWDSSSSPETANEFISFLNSLDLNVYNEISSPRFINKSNTISFSLLAGVIFVNGSILRDGSRRDYMQLLPMKPALEAATGQSCLRDFAIMMYEVVDDNAELSNAVVKRAFTWCSYYGAIPWIGRVSEVTDAKKNRSMECPDGAFDWIKKDKVVAIHETWRTNSKISYTPTPKSAYAPLSFIPGLSEALELHHVDYSPQAEQILDIQHFNWLSKVVYRPADPLSTSTHGIDYSGLGCFPIGMHVSQHDFDTVLRSQTRLDKLKLLQKVEATELKQMGERIRVLTEDTSWTTNPNEIAIVKELVELLTTASAEGKEGSADGLIVYLGLDTGFRTPDQKSQLWGVFDGDNDTTRLFIARKAKDLASTILHTYLSSNRCPRSRCFDAEAALSEAHGRNKKLPERMSQDLDMLSPEEMLRFLQGLAISGSTDQLSLIIRECCEERLVDVSTTTQLRKQCTISYLRGEISVKDLLSNRLLWYRQQKIPRVPHLDAAISLFTTIDKVIIDILRSRSRPRSNALIDCLSKVILPGKIDPRADLLALSIFCSFRRLAFEELYIDITDRNPIFNDQPDQAAIFAELFGLGSKTEPYLDCTPQAFGKVLYDKYRATYRLNQPPLEADDGSCLATTYTSANPDIDREGITDEKRDWIKNLRNTSYIGVFAIPALIDILLLTTTGRGLYLSAHMGDTAQEMATYALLMALILSGGVSSWIGMGGSYYLWARVYPTMNMFMITRMIGGITLVSILGGIGFVAIAVAYGLRETVGHGFVAAAMFLLYLVVLTCYLFTLSVLSNLQFPGSPLPSGRTAIGQSLLILIISPILSKIIESHTGIERDIIIYPVVLIVFLLLLFLRTRQVMAKWNTWLLEIPTNTDQQVQEWYINTHHDGNKAVGFQGLTGPAAMQLSRTQLYEAVKQERSKNFWEKPTSDPNVAKLAKAYSTTLFVLDWYTGIVGAKQKPLPYSSTWNLQINVAINALRINDKGLRLHNAFNHWRFANTEIACGVMYFILALLDRWIELVCGGKLIGIAILGDNDARIAIGFSLVYYLFSAFILDFLATPLFAKVVKGSDLKVKSASHLNEVAKMDAGIKKRLYWRTLAKFLGLHLWGLGVCSAMIWTYVANRNATILFLAYAISYCGLLWYQYNKIYCTNGTAGPIALAILIGLSVGLPLRLTHPLLFYNDVLALGVATWIAGILTFRRVDLSAHTFQELEDSKPFKPPPHSQKAIGPGNDISTPKLSDLFDELEALPKTDTLAIKNPSAMAQEVLQILTKAKHATKAVEVKAAFPHAFDLLNHIIVGWETGEVIVVGVPLPYLVNQKVDVCAVSRKVDRRLKIFVGMDLRGRDWMTNFTINAHAIAEAIVHETCEVGLGLSHSDAVLAELLITSTEELRLPLRIQRQLDMSSPSELLLILKSRDTELVRHMGLETDFDQEWDSLPHDIKTMLVKRVCGEPYEINELQLDWIERKCGNRTPYHVYLARRDLNACLALLVDEYTATLLRDPAQKMVPTRRERPKNIVEEVEIEVVAEKGRFHMLKSAYRRVIRILRNFIKFIIIALIAEPETQRELAYLLTGNPLRRLFVFILTRLWKYSRFIQDLILPFFMFSGRPHVQKLAKVMRNGTTTTLKHNRLLIDNLKASTTAFLEPQRDGGLKLWQYTGTHVKKPESDWLLISINLYSKSLSITRRQEFQRAELINDYVYEYPSQHIHQKIRRPRRLPCVRYCVAGTTEGEMIKYSSKGFVKSGQGVRNGVPYEWTYDYRRKAKFDDDLLRVKYVFNPTSATPLTVNVWWCVPPVRHAEESDRWIPFSRVTHARFVQNGDIYETKWTYDHKCHPTLSTLLNGEESKTPDMILHDHLAVLGKPISTSFVDEDPLLPFNSIKTNFLTRMFGLHKKQTRVSTSRSRAFLWKSWKDSTQFDGVTARFLDELALRSDPILAPYWSFRDSGNIHAAIKYLRTNGDAIMASVDIPHEISAWTSLAYKMSDFFSMGTGGDTSINTRTTNGQINDSGEQLHVLATDTGTYPNEGGGVSCCRRDMVNNLQYVKWHIVAETANDYGIPRFQIEQNIQSLKILPLWGLDFLTPTHGIMENTLDTAMDEMMIDTSPNDIRLKFLPILTSLVKGARCLKFTETRIEEYTKALVSLNSYFETRNWGAVWGSKIVKNKWRELWLTGASENMRPIQEWFEVERPTIPDLDAGLDLVPETIPTVFQATHHSIGASYGILAKLKRNATFQIWDHAISWRETNMFLSSSQCTFPAFVRISLVGLMWMAAHLNMYHADVILPCTSYFNPGWEIELGSAEGQLVHRKIFSRKVDPVVNGICNMDSFTPITEIKTEKPTVTMLSHVQFTKDVKTALLAADIIINHWHFKDYQLHIYGSLDRTPSYTVECQELIASKNLQSHIFLKGYGNPTAVFSDTWVFLNSSLSEGLPLAIGEAALTGAPIVCTDVGATWQVVSDPNEPGRRYGGVVPPNDPEALARGQIAMLAVLDEWQRYGEDTEPVPGLPDVFTTEEVERITKRMYAKREQRQKVGGQLRSIVQKSFSGDRYLREHEQMLWLGKHIHQSRLEQLSRDNGSTVIETGQMLDDMYSGIDVREYRPEFLRHVSGFSAFNSTAASELRSDMSERSTSFYEDNLGGSRETVGMRRESVFGLGRKWGRTWSPSRLGRRSVDEEGDLEKGKIFESDSEETMETKESV